MTKYAFIDDSHGILSSSSMIKRSSSDFGDEGLPMASSISYDFELLVSISITAIYLFATKLHAIHFEPWVENYCNSSNRIIIAKI
ncbi:hypothetical protein CUMW_238900 [Citrus unshiu]|uniref:Uncharacterized protein n=1 Tax=Citrus unshiu TaxID=55188 RepID=A0A2H5QKJ5_CITUN|nr:hypothetical protein CUMW_238900 [Citrus unshiu]